MSASITEGYSYRAEQAANNYASRAQDRITRDCRGGSLDAQTKCIKEIVEASREAQTAERDLSAQQQMAFWAFSMFLVSLLSVGLTVVGIVFVKRTLETNIELARHAAETNKTAREIGEAQVRAYLTFHDVRVDFDGYLPRVRFKLFNAGSSPATNIIAAGGCIRETISEQGTGPVFSAGTMVGTLRAGVESDPITIYVGHPIHEIISTHIAVPMSLIKAMLRVTFEDVFGKTRRLRANFIGIVEGSHRDKKALFVREELSLTAVDRIGPGVLDDEDED